VSTLGEMIQLHQFQFNYILTFFQVTATHCAHRLSCLRASLYSGSQRACSWSSYDNFYKKRTSVMKTA